MDDSLVQLAEENAAKLARSVRLRERCSILADIVRQVAPIYRLSATTMNQRQLIETMIGAAIWYLPQGGDLWTNRISVKAIESFHPVSGVASPKLTADHEFPRKVAATELLSLDWDTVVDPSSELLLRYTERYGRFNYITPNENRRLMQFQRTAKFETVKKAYEQAGVVLLAATRGDLVRIKMRDRAVIEELISGGIGGVARPAGDDFAPK
jgi:hypothetical protein